jgi:hypothetical protein
MSQQQVKAHAAAVQAFIVRVTQLTATLVRLIRLKGAGVTMPPQLGDFQLLLQQSRAAVEVCSNVGSISASCVCMYVFMYARMYVCA